jgi:hypothetical protein
VIGAGLAAAARGRGYRWIARWLGRPADTARGWLRRFTSTAGWIRVAFTRLLSAVDPDPLPLGAAVSSAADAVNAIVACSRAIAVRWGMLAVTPRAVTDGTLLGPQMRVRSINTSSPLPINRLRFDPILMAGNIEAYRPVPKPPSEHHLRTTVPGLIH